MVINNMPQMLSIVYKLPKKHKHCGFLVLSKHCCVCLSIPTIMSTRGVSLGWDCLFFWPLGGWVEYLRILFFSASIFTNPTGNASDAEITNVKLYLTWIIP